jgi:hypothetical protein
MFEKHQFYPLGMTNIAIENGPVEIVDLPINSMVDLSIVLCTFTRGYPNLGVDHHMFYVYNPSCLRILDQLCIAIHYPEKFGQLERVTLD